MEIVEAFLCAKIKKETLQKVESLRFIVCQ